MAANPSASTFGAPAEGVDDFLTVGAIGILAYIGTDVAHEVVGHGLGLLLAGGRTGILTTTRLIHIPGLPDPAWRIFDIGGPAGNLIWAGLCILAQHRIARASAAWRLFLWATSSFSLLWECGYLMKCGFTGQGDAMALLTGWKPAWVWRALLFAAGCALYRQALFFISAELHFVQSAKAELWRRRLARLLLPLCLGGGLIACAGPIFDPRGRIEMLNSGALTSFASWVGLFAIPSLFHRYADSSRVAAGPVQRSIPWILLAAAASIFFVAILGPGIPFPFLPGIGARF